MPFDGSHPSLSAKQYINSMPSQNDGIAARTIDSVVVERSRKEYCLTAESMPSGIPMIVAHSMPLSAMRMETAAFFCISAHTGVPLR